MNTERFQTFIQRILTIALLLLLATTPVHSQPVLTVPTYSDTRAAVMSANNASPAPPAANNASTTTLALSTVPLDTPARTSSLNTDALRTYINTHMQQWEIPGMAVAIVRNDRVIFSEGFGEKKLGSGDPVNEHTLFGIASVTKAMTATAMGMLVDEGLLHWDDPVIKHLPWFELSDPWVTRHVTLRDLLRHSVGTGRLTGNRIEFMPNRSREEIIRFLRHQEFEQPFRSESVYSNIMYMVAGEVIAAASGMSWDDFMSERLLGPLGMNRSNTSITLFDPEDDNIAWPHQEINGAVVPIPRRNFDNVGASASVNSTVQELSRWMRFNLGEPGVLNGVRYVSRETMREIHHPQLVGRMGSIYGPINTYALGWDVTDYKGRRMLRHGGATDGMNTNLVLLPNEEIGIVIVTNTFNRFMTALANHIMDELLGEEPTDWNGRIWSSWQAQVADARAAMEAVDAGRIEGTRTTLNPEDYTGVYHHPLYDTAEVYLEEGKLRIRFWNDDTQVLELEHWHFDTFRAAWINPAKREKFVYFTLGDDGTVELLNVTWTLRPRVLQVGIYPSDYTRLTRFERQR